MKSETRKWFQVYVGGLKYFICFLSVYLKLLLVMDCMKLLFGKPKKGFRKARKKFQKWDIDFIGHGGKLKKIKKFPITTLQVKNSGIYWP